MSRIWLLSIAATICGCSTNNTSYNNNIDWQAERIKFCLSGLEETEQEVYNELDIVVSINNVNRPSWENRLKVYKYSCMFYRSLLIEQIDMYSTMHSQKIIDDDKYVELLKKEVERICPLYLKAVIASDVSPKLAMAAATEIVAKFNTAINQLN